MQTTARRAAASLLLAATLALTAACSSSEPEADESGAAVPTKEAPATDVETTEDSTDTGAEDQEAALDAYVTALQATIPQLMEQFDGTYSAITIEGVQPDTVVYSYTYAELLDAPATAAALDAQIGQLQELCDSAVFPEMEREGITVDPKVGYVYVNADGAEIWSHTFAKS